MKKTEDNMQQNETLENQNVVETPENGGEGTAPAEENSNIIGATPKASNKKKKDDADTLTAREKGILSSFPNCAVVYLNKFGGVFDANAPEHLLKECKKIINPFYQE
ncbi:MAG: hypothetical protein IKO36_09100 [Bacteroidaceae bacterium]|nr:hypothetical protein [Bacteroidaceae bacterium]